MVRRPHSFRSPVSVNRPIRWSKSVDAGLPSPCARHGTTTIGSMLGSMGARRVVRRSPYEYARPGDAECHGTINAIAQHRVRISAAGPVRTRVNRPVDDESVHAERSCGTAAKWYRISRGRRISYGCETKTRCRQGGVLCNVQHFFLQKAFAFPLSVD